MFGRISLVCGGAEKLFSCRLLFVSDIIMYFFVQCLYAVDDIQCGITLFYTSTRYIPLLYS